MSTSKQDQPKKPEIVVEGDIENGTERSTDTTNNHPAIKAGHHALVLGGVSGVLAGMTYVVGFLIFGLKLRDMFEEDKLSPTESLEFLKENETIFYVANLLVYIVNGFLQIILSCSMYEYLRQELRNGSCCPQTQQTYINVASVVGCFWGALVITAGMIGNGGAHVVLGVYEDDPQQAVTIWKTIDAVYTNGIGGGNEIVGAVWVSIVSILSLCGGCQKALPKPLNILGILAGVAGAVTIVPSGLDEATSVFGIAMTVWYILVGAWLLRAYRLSMK